MNNYYHGDYVKNLHLQFLVCQQLLWYHQCVEICILWMLLTPTKTDHKEVNLCKNLSEFQVNKLTHNPQYQNNQMEQMIAQNQFVHWEL